jgi:hypothetical protein
MIATYSQS